jgi:hypothetical protein
MDEPVTSHVEECPFLVAVVADRLWRDPTSAYCRRPDGRVRVPARSTMACICMTQAHLVCPGYLEAVGYLSRTTVP